MANGKGIQYSIEKWRISGIQHRGEVGTYELAGELIPEDAQENQIEQYGEEVASSDLLWTIATKGYELSIKGDDKEKEYAEKLRRFLQDGFRKYSNTSTSVIWTPKGSEDRVIHNPGTGIEQVLRANFTGKSNWIKDLYNKGILKPVLGTEDAVRINEVSNWINGTDMCSWLLKYKLSKEDERIVGFYADSDRLILNCDRNPFAESSAFRVCRVE